MPSRRRAAALEDRFVVLRTVLLLAAVLFASAALHRPLRDDGGRSLTARGSRELRAAVLRPSVPGLARAHAQPGDGSGGVRGVHPLASKGNAWPHGAPIAAGASVVDRAGATTAPRGLLPSWRAPPSV
ncbi:MAG TPA: hypothetical protein VL328_03100 [Gemmatimonadaceae bacterium]|jgi:hypothetical protein|nr:hypothetical protein [Gemmatimonadaceae bacterium]